jgi:sugar phosphate isomerase/epimerase
MSTQQPQLGAAMDVRFGVSVESFLAYITDLGLSHLELKREYLEGFPDTPTPATLGALTDRYDVSLTYHAPFRDWNMGSFNDAIRRNSVARVKQTLDDAAAADAGGVVVHAGSVPRRYPEWVRDKAHNNARKSLRECAVYADRVGVPLCVENQPIDDRDIRHTTTVADLASAVSIDGTDASLDVTVDIGHANVNGHEYQEFVEKFGDQIRVCHLHDNDGTSDQHEPLSDYDEFMTAIPADYFVFEMTSLADIGVSVGRPDVTVPECEL